MGSSSNGKPLKSLGRLRCCFLPHVTLALRRRFGFAKCRRYYPCNADPNMNLAGLCREQQGRALSLDLFANGKRAASLGLMHASRRLTQKRPAKEQAFSTFVGAAAQKIKSVASSTLISVLSKVTASGPFAEITVCAPFWFIERSAMLFTPR
jgi:hypothetical protein